MYFFKKEVFPNKDIGKSSLSWINSYACGTYFCVHNLNNIVLAFESKWTHFSENLCLRLGILPFFQFITVTKGI